MAESGKSHPDWVKVRYKQSCVIDDVESFLSQNKVNTVCSSALCPNRGQCFNDRAMTFLLLGSKCTRSCRFCSVDKKPGDPYTAFEKDAENVLLAVRKFNLRYVTLTSPTRDDLPDGGASVFAETISRLKQLEKPPKVEALIPDFLGNVDFLQKVLDSQPDVIAHNLETVPRLYYRTRVGADWERSISILKHSRNHGKAITKSAFIVGLGETDDELIEAMRKAFDAGCEVMIIGQYLRPTKSQMEVERYVTPDQFRMYEREGEKIGFKVIMAGPLYRSSYKAEEAFYKAKGMYDRNW
jgi:lipoic acid synthetase